MTEIKNWVIKDNITYENNEDITINDNKSYFDDEDDDDKNDDIENEDYNGKKLKTGNLMLDSMNNNQNEVILSNIEQNKKVYNIYNNVHDKSLNSSKDQNKLSNFKKHKRQLSKDDYKLKVNTQKTPADQEYDYEQFKKEYDQYLEEIKKHEAKLNSTNFQMEPKSQCDSDKFLNKGPFTIACLISESWKGPTEEIKRNAKSSLNYLLKLWMIFILAFFLIGWGHFGLCNILCPFSWCFPEDRYEEIKQFLVMNIPGTITTDIITKSDEKSQTVIEKQHYIPTDTEYYLYNSLWNDIYRV